MQQKALNDSKPKTVINKVKRFNYEMIYEMIDGVAESLLEFQGGETLKLKVDAAQTEGGRGVMIKKRRGEGDQCQGGWFGSSSSIHLCIEKKKKQAADLR